MLWETAKRAIKVRAIKAPITIRIVNNYKSSFDTFGSYTGTDSTDKFEKPVQDADDL